MKLRTIIFDLGNTLIEQRVDSEIPLDGMELNLLPDVRQTLIDLHGTYKLGLLSNTTRSGAGHVQRALSKLSISRFFDVIVTSFDHGIEKPNPELFAIALRELAADPGSTLMVGDDIAKDIRPARELGLRTGLLTSVVDAQDSVSDFEFTSFKELPGCIKILEEGWKEPR